MRKIDQKFDNYIKDKSGSYSLYEGFSMLDIQHAYEDGYKQAIKEILGIWANPKNMFNWIKARSREGLVYIGDLINNKNE